MSRGRAIQAVLIAALLVAPADATRQAAPGRKPLPKPPAGASRSAAPQLQPLGPEQRQALGLLDKLAADARAIDDEAMRIRIVVRVADLLWQRDEAAARALFTRAFDESDNINDDAGGRIFGGLERARLRAEIINAVLRHDPELANRFIKIAGDDAEDDLALDDDPFADGSEQSAMLVEAALALARTDPAAAADLGRQSLRGGIAESFGELLTALAGADRRLADDLAGDASESLAAMSRVPLGVFGLVEYVFPDIPFNGSLAGSPGGDAVNVALARQFLQSVWAVAAQHLEQLSGQTGGAAQDDAQATTGIYFFLHQLAPKFQQYDPEHLDGVRVALGQLSSLTPPAQRDQIEAYGRGGETPAGLVSRAEETADPAARQSLYTRAAMVALQGGDYAEAKSIAAKIESEEARDLVLGRLGHVAAMQSLGKRMYDEAWRAASEIPQLEQRASAFVAIAQAAIDAKDRARAVELLDKAEQSISKSGTTATLEKARTLVLLAEAYARVDALRGFEAMQGAIAVVNTVTRVSTGTGSLGESSATPAGAGGVRTAVAQLAPGLQGLEALARFDYFRALGLAQSLDNRALSILAQLAVARGALRGGPAAVPATKKGAKPSAKAPPRGSKTPGPRGGPPKAPATNAAPVGPGVTGDPRPAPDPR